MGTTEWGQPNGDNRMGTTEWGQPNGDNRMNKISGNFGTEHKPSAVAVAECRITILNEYCIQ